MNLLTKEEMATKLRASKRTVENWSAQGHIPPPVYIGRRALWVEESIVAWLQQKAGLNTPSSAGAAKQKRGRPRVLQ